MTYSIKYSLPLLAATMLSLVMALNANAAPDEADDWFESAIGTLINDTISDATLAEPFILSTLTLPPALPLSPGQCSQYVYVNNINPDAPFRRGRGNLIVGSIPEARALQLFSWTSEAAHRYADVANTYADTFGTDVNVYVMPVPLASAFYTPRLAQHLTSQQHDFILALSAALNSRVIPVDIYPILGSHADEPIYSRTDHHWAPLGAYYAAAQFAAVAGVPFLPNTCYSAVEIPDYVGTMYKFAGNAAEIKNSPETFVYYRPNPGTVDYSSTFITYSLDRKRRYVTSQSEPAEGEFFQPFHGVATYCTFMGGDQKLTRVVTSTPGNRRLLILKDSFGNAIPGYLFGSFSEIHVADCRYFTPNIIDYVRANNITDILFVNNVGHAILPRTTDSYLNYLTQ